MSNLQAAIGLAQFEQIAKFLNIKIKNGILYREKLNGIPGLKFHPIKKYSKCVYWMYGLELSSEAGLTAEDLMLRLKSRGIDTRPFFKGLHIQPALNALGLFTGEKYPVTESATKFGFYIPSSITLTEAQINRIAETIKTEIRA